MVFSKRTVYARNVFALFLYLNVHTSFGTTLFSNDYDKFYASISITLGFIPSECSNQPGELKSRDLYEINQFGTIYKVVINSCGNNVYMYEAVPLSKNKNTPVVIALHQTTRHGKDEVMGYAGDKNLAYGAYYFQAGYVVLSPDVFLAGENYSENIDWDTSKFYKKYPSWSATSRMLVDNIAVSNYANKYYGGGCKVAIGHSLGGFNARILGAFEGSIDVVVSSSPFESLVYDPKAVELSRDHWFVFIPSLRSVLLKPPPRDVPWDHDVPLKMMAYRKSLIIIGLNDKLYLSDIKNFNYVIDSANKYISSRGGNKVSVITHSGAHVFGPDLQAESEDFVRRSCLKY